MSRRRPGSVARERRERLEIGVRIDDDPCAERRQPSMMLAWFSASEKTTSSGPRSAEMSADVGVVAGVEEQRRLGALPARDARLERAMRREVADDQTGGAGSEAVLGHGASAASRRSGRVGQAEVVVGREVGDATAIDEELGGLGAIDGAHSAA